MKESGDNVMLFDASPVSPDQGLGSPIATVLINVGGDSNIFARFVRFPSEGIVDLVERPPQAERSHDHQVHFQHCIRSQGLFHSPLPYDLKTGLLIRSSVAQGKRHKEYSFDEGREEAAWDQFCESYGLGGLDLSEEEVILAGESLGGSGSSS